MLRRDLLGQLIRFALSGGIATATYVVAIVALLRFYQLDAPVASAIAYALGVLVSYVLQSRFTFKIQQDTTRSILGFIVVSGLGFVLSYVIVAVADRVGLSDYIAVALVCVIIPGVNFLLLRSQVFLVRRSA